MGTHGSDCGFDRAYFPATGYVCDFVSARYSWSDTDSRMGGLGGRLFSGQCERGGIRGGTRGGIRGGIRGGTRGAYRLRSHCAAGNEPAMTTPHNHAAQFGRRFAGCPLCVELAAGAHPVTWSSTRKAKAEAQRVAEIRAHFASEYHRSGKCGPVCTFGDW